MAIGRNILASACLAALAVPVSAAACPPAGDPTRMDSQIEAREKATNASLLAALIQRRSEVTKGAEASDDKRRTLDLLDSRIAEVKRRLGT